MKDVWFAIVMGALWSSPGFAQDAVTQNESTGPRDRDRHRLESRGPRNSRRKRARRARLQSRRHARRTELRGAGRDLGQGRPALGRAEGRGHGPLSDRHHTSFAFQEPLIMNHPTSPREVAPSTLEALRRSSLGAAIAAALLAHSATGSAQDAATETLAAVTASPSGLIDEVVVVRARNRVENQQDVPISISVVRGEEIERLQANDINSLTMRAANVAWNQGNQRTSSLSIRGVGKQGQTEAQDPSVGVIVDGVNYAYNALTSSFDFTDIDVVEVVRGPQGTLLGKNTSLGVVNVTTRRPTFVPEFDYSVTVGERDTVIGRAAGGGPIIDDVLAWRGALNFNKAEGWLKDPYNPDVTYQNKDRVSGRVQLLWTPPDSKLSARFAIDSTPRSGEATNGVTINTPAPLTYADGSPNTSLTNELRLGRPYFTQYGNYSVNGDYFFGGPSGDAANIGSTRRPLVTGSSGATIELNWDEVGPFTLTSITAYKDYHFNAWNDDGTPFDVYRNSGGFWNDYEQTSQELRLSSQTGRFVDYQTGLYLIKVDNVADYRRSWGTDAGSWFASNAQYGRLDVAVNPDGSVSGGRYLLQNSLAGLAMSYNSPAGVQEITNESAAVFGQANWHFTDSFTLTTGVRVTNEDRTNITRSTINDSGAAPELNPFVVNGVNLGGFDSNAATGALLAGNTAAQLSLADRVANKYFGAPIGAVPGTAYAALTAQQLRQVADAKALRRAQIGVVFDDVAAEPFEDTQLAFVLSPTYRFSDNITGYLSWQYGEKAGISQTTNGISNLVAGEENSAYEIGVKGVLLNGNLVLNTDYFLSDIGNYQQGVRIVDEYTTALNAAAGITDIAYTTATGNVPKVRAKGLEIDGVYGGIPNTQLRFAVAYNDAYYVSFPNAAQPSENGFAGASPYQDISGETLPGSPRLSGSVGFDWRRPAFGDKELHLSANVTYADKTNTDNSLSAYGWLPSTTVTDISIGVGRLNGEFDVSLLAKNAFDEDTPMSVSSSSYTVREPRWVGVVFAGRL
jgi:iron complex outermembrane recepter protein